MSEQINLPLDEEKAIETRIDRQFTKFHEANPNVYRELTTLARQAYDAHRKKIGIGMLFEVLRWNRMINTVDGASKFKLNNNYRSRYARMIMERHPELKGIFDTRELQS